MTMSHMDQSAISILAREEAKETISNSKLIV